MYHSHQGACRHAPLLLDMMILTFRETTQWILLIYDGRKRSGRYAIPSEMGKIFAQIHSLLADNKNGLVHAIAYVLGQIPEKHVSPRVVTFTDHDEIIVGCLF